MIGQISDIGIFSRVRGVEGSMNTQNNPLDVRVAASLLEVLLQVVILLAA